MHGWLDTEFFEDLTLNGSFGAFAWFDAAAHEAPELRVSMTSEQVSVRVLDDCSDRRQQ